SEGKAPTYVLLERRSVEFDEDDMANEIVGADAAAHEPSRKVADIDLASLCRVCGGIEIGEGAQPSCEHAASQTNVLSVSVIRGKAVEDAGLRACVSCGSVAQREIVPRFVTGQ